MKITKKTKAYCRYCKKHTEHTVSVAKKANRGALKKGALQRLEKRGSGKAGYGNHGKYSRKAISAWKRIGAKTSKKSDLRYKCGVCKKSSVRSRGRTKKLELV